MHFRPQPTTLAVTQPSGQCVLTPWSAPPCTLPVSPRKAQGVKLSAQRRKDLIGPSAPQDHAVTARMALPARSIDVRTADGKAAVLTWALP
ncbi:hypothetical protein HGRIS_001318 [Hohenbuehelia grisea]|uniref:Uncharacterized protein n=1 Tax=Hohenbuehelia grisea TaxID=104357 RepID=A0ABR3JQC2_9AGAR